MRAFDPLTGISMRLIDRFDPPRVVRLVVDAVCWQCSTEVYRGGRIRMIGYSDDFPADCAEQQTRGCQVSYGFNTFENYVAKLAWTSVLVQYPVDAGLHHDLRSNT